MFNAVCVSSGFRCRSCCFFLPSVLHYSSHYINIGKSGQDVQKVGYKSLILCVANVIYIYRLTIIHVQPMVSQIGLSEIMSMATGGNFHDLFPVYPVKSHSPRSRNHSVVHADGSNCRVFFSRTATNMAAPLDAGCKKREKHNFMTLQTS